MNTIIAPMRRNLPVLALSLLAGCGDSTATMDPDASAPTDVASEAGADASDASDATDASEDVAPDVQATPCEPMRRSFWTWNLRVMPPPDVELEAGCRVERPHLRVYAIDSVWGAGLNEARTAAVARAFEDATPADPTRGIYAIETGVFGEPPDVDTDPHISLLYQDMGSFRGFTFDGFFRSIDQSTTDAHSNRTEMLHLDAVRMDPTNEYMLGVVAHEFVHLLASQYGTEDVWLSETLAEAGMAMTGYLGDLRLARNFAMTARAPLVANTAGMDYGPLFLFGDYLLERFGAPAVGTIARSRARGVASVTPVLGTSSFRDVFADWAVANLVDAPMPPYGYAAFDITTEAAATPLTAAAASSLTASPWAASYARFDATSASVRVAIESTAFANLVVRAVTYDPDARGAAAVTAQTIDGAMSSFTVAVPSGQRRVVIVVANASTTAAPFQITVTP